MNPSFSSYLVNDVDGPRRDEPQQVLGVVDRRCPTAAGIEQDEGDASDGGKRAGHGGEERLARRPKNRWRSSRSTHLTENRADTCRERSLRTSLFVSVKRLHGFSFQRLTLAGIARGKMKHHQVSNLSFTGHEAGLPSR